MSSAYDTIRRDTLIDIVKNFLDDNEVKLIQLLLSNTTLGIRINKNEAESPQGDTLSGVLFNIYNTRQKSWDTSHFSVFCNELSSPSPPETMLVFW